jgi:glycosyltransferase involved in cell wall biosynthesis
LTAPVSASEQEPVIAGSASFDHAFTVFTPTFNRAHTLHRVRESLEAQTFRDFEWLVVDDGSTDGTDDLVSEWAAASSFPIRLVRQEHGNKHVAMGRAIAEAHGELFLTFDSDDTCVPWALQRLWEHWQAIPADERPGFSAVTGLCVDEQGELVGDPFPFDPTDSDSLEIRFKHQVGGEKWGFQRTDVMRSHGRPELPGPPGLAKPPEGIIWDSIARRYRTRYVNEALRVYWRDQPEALSRPRRRTEPNVGLHVGYQVLLDEDLGWLPYAPFDFYLEAARYVRTGLHCRIPPLEQRRRLRRPAGRWLWAAALPAGIFMFAADHLRDAAAELARARRERRVEH